MKILTMYNRLLLCASILAIVMMSCVAKQQEKNNIAISIVDCSRDVKAPLLTTYGNLPLKTEQCLAAGLKPLRIFVWNKSNAPITIASNSFNIPIMSVSDATYALRKSQIVVPWLKGTAAFF
jgi:hypothetical protein